MYVVLFSFVNGPSTTPSRGPDVTTSSALDGSLINDVLLLCRLTFELHHGKRVLMSETVRNAGSCLVPESIMLENNAPMLKTPKRKRSSSQRYMLPPCILSLAYFSDIGYKF